MVIRLRQVKDFFLENGILYFVSPTKYKEVFTTFEGHKIKRTFIRRIEKWSELKDYVLKSGYDNLDQWVYWIMCFIVRGAANKYLYKGEIIYE